VIGPEPAAAVLRQRHLGDLSRCRPPRAKPALRSTRPASSVRERRGDVRESRRQRELESFFRRDDRHLAGVRVQRRQAAAVHRQLERGRRRRGEEVEYDAQRVDVTRRDRVHRERHADRVADRGRIAEVRDLDAVPAHVDAIEVERRHERIARFVHDADDQRVEREIGAARATRMPQQRRQRRHPRGTGGDRRRQEPNPARVHRIGARLDEECRPCDRIRRVDHRNAIAGRRVAHVEQERVRDLESMRAERGGVGQIREHFDVDRVVDRHRDERR
jgi:hypothetical protein